MCGKITKSGQKRPQGSGLIMGPGQMAGNERGTGKCTVKKYREGKAIKTKNPKKEKTTPNRIGSRNKLAQGGMKQLRGEGATRASPAENRPE